MASPEPCRTAIAVSLFDGAESPEALNAEMAEYVSDLIVKQLGLTMHLAPQSRDEDGEVWCCSCHSRDGLALVAPGWGGVYACRDCHPRAARPTR
jgi:hypothetical protein